MRRTSRGRRRLAKGSKQAARVYVHRVRQKDCTCCQGGNLERADFLAAKGSQWLGTRLHVCPVYTKSREQTPTFSGCAGSDTGGTNTNMFVSGRSQE